MHACTLLIEVYSKTQQQLEALSHFAFRGHQKNPLHSAFYLFIYLFIYLLSLYYV